MTSLRPSTGSRSSLPAARHRSGALVALASESTAEWLGEVLAALSVEVRVAADDEDALRVLNQDEAPELLIVSREAGAERAADLCHRVQSDGRSASTYVLVLGTVEHAATGRGPHECVAEWRDVDALRGAVRRAMRSQAQQRVLARQERRRAMAWMTSVVSHEINNPLVGALVAHQQLAELALQLAPEHSELRALLEESSEALQRIQHATQRLTARLRVDAGVVERITLPELAARLRSVLRPTGRPFVLAAERRSDQTVACNVELLLEAVRAVVTLSRRYADGEVSVKLHADSVRLAAVVEVPGVSEVHPETLLEPQLVSRDGAPPELDSQVAGLEAQLEAHGAQLFASQNADKWRFGLTLPNHLGRASGEDSEQTG